MDMKSFMTAAGVVVSASLIAGCGGGVGAGTTGQFNVGGQTVTYTAARNVGGPGGGPVTRLFAGQCIYEARNESATATALAPILVDAAVGSLGDALKRAGAPRAYAVHAGLRIRDHSTTGASVAASDVVTDPSRRPGTGVSLEVVPGTLSGPPADVVATTGSRAAPVTSIASGIAHLATAEARMKERSMPQHRPAGVSLEPPLSVGNGASKASPRGLDGHPSTTSYRAMDCVQLVHGEFVGQAMDHFVQDYDCGHTDGLASWLCERGAVDKRSARAFQDTLNAHGIYLSAPPHVFLEAEIVRAAGGQYALTPTFIDYRRTLESGAASGRRGLFLEFGVNHGHTTLADDKASKGVLAIGRMDADADPIRFQERDPRAPQMLWTKPPDGDRTADNAMNVELRLVEVRDARPVLAALGDALSGEDGDALADALRQDLLPTPEEDAAGVTMQISALNQYQEALRKYQGAIDACEAAVLAAGDNTQAANVARSQGKAGVDAAWLAVQLAAFQAKVSAPSPIASATCG